MGWQCTVRTHSWAWLFVVASGLAPACGDEGSQPTTTTPFEPTSSGNTSPDTSAGTETTEEPPTSGVSTTQGPGTSTATASDGPDDADGTTATMETTAGSTTDAPGFDGEPGEFTLTFDGRDYRMYVPSGYGAGSAIPLLVGFHGAGDSGGNFYMFSQLVGMGDAAEPSAYILVVPDTKSTYSDFANWSGNPNNDIDEMLAEMDEILALVDDIGIHYNLDEQQLHAFGFSNGGLFTALAGMANTDRFATLSVMGYGWGGSYLPPGSPAREIPVQFGCGSSDGFYGGAQAAEAFLAGQGHDTRLVTAAGVGHSFTGVMGALTPADLFGWMQARPLP